MTLPSEEQDANFIPYSSGAHAIELTDPEWPVCCAIFPQSPVLNSFHMDTSPLNVQTASTVPNLGWAQHNDHKGLSPLHQYKRNELHFKGSYYFTILGEVV